MSVPDELAMASLEEPMSVPDELAMASLEVPILVPDERVATLVAMLEASFLVASVEQRVLFLASQVVDPSSLVEQGLPLQATLLLEPLRMVL